MEVNILPWKIVIDIMFYNYFCLTIGPNRRRWAQTNEVKSREAVMMQNRRTNPYRTRGNELTAMISEDFLELKPIWDLHPVVSCRWRSYPHRIIDHVVAMPARGCFCQNSTCDQTQNANSARLKKPHWDTWLPRLEKSFSQTAKNHFLRRGKARLYA